MTNNSFVFNMDKVSKVFDILVSLAPDVPIQIKEDGWHMTLLSSSQADALHCIFKKEAFDEYSFNKEEEFNIQSNDVKMFKKFKGVTAFTISEGELQVMVGNKKFIGTVMEYSNKFKMPNVELEANVKLTDSQISDVTSTFSFVKDEDSLLFQIDKNLFIKSTKKLSNMELCFELDNHPEVKPSKYSYNILKNYLVKGICKEYTLRFSPEKPLIVEYHKEGFDLKAFIAPRVDND